MEESQAEAERIHIRQQCSAPPTPLSSHSTPLLGSSTPRPKQQYRSVLGPLHRPLRNQPPKLKSLSVGAAPAVAALQCSDPSRPGLTTWLRPARTPKHRTMVTTQRTCTCHTAPVRPPWTAAQWATSKHCTWHPIPLCLHTNVQFTTILDKDAILLWARSAVTVAHGAYPTYLQAASPHHRPVPARQRDGRPRQPPAQGTRHPACRSVVHLASHPEPGGPGTFPRPDDASSGALSQA